jgi:ATP-binding cassette subfamily C protein
MVGLLQPTSGHILADDTALSPENITRWRASIAYVPQEVFLFDDSILNNVLMGAADAGAERVERALDLADIGDFVRQLPDGIHTHIGEKGVRLSGGQRQRLGLARALFSDPAILVLDEATSALDNVTERGIINALNNLPQDITTIVIAHRLSTVQHSDRIYFLEQGEIVGQGDYNDLIDTNPAFAEMAQLA